MRCSFALAFFSTALWLLAVLQQTRGMIADRVTDSQGGAIVGAAVTVINTLPNSAVKVAPQDRGYYDANLPLPGNYEVRSEASGFKKSIRTGLMLPVGTNLDVDFRMEVGAVSGPISTTDEAPMLGTSTVSSGPVLDNRTLRNLPVVANNVIILARLTVGMQTSGINPSYAMLGSISAASDVIARGDTLRS